MKYQRLLGAVLCAASLSLACLLSGCGASFCGLPLGGKEELVFICLEESEAAVKSAGGQGDEPVPGTEHTGEQPVSPEEETEEDSGAAASDEAVYDGRIDLNSATMEELMTLNGVGESRAKAIIEYRARSPFEKIEDIMQIPGIKEGIFSKIKDQITVH